MSAALDTHAWNRGSQDGSKKSRYAFAPAHREPRRAGPGPATLRAKPPDTITRPADPYRDRKKKRRPAAEPDAVPLRFTATGSAAHLHLNGGVKIARR
jgi:hypothetical protein